MSNRRIIILACEGLTTDLLTHCVLKHSENTFVVLENSESNLTRIKRRFKKLPAFRVLGQLGFLGILLPLLKLTGKKRVQQLVHDYTQSGQRRISAEKIIRINTANNLDWLQNLELTVSDLIIVNGTRIISESILKKIPCDILNIHVGITPAYRGIHGGYWALYRQDSLNFGVTLHRVDSGVDTGSVIAQSVITIQKNDQFTTYPVLQFIEGLHLLELYLKNSNELMNYQPITQSRSDQYYHPGFFQYLAKRLLKGVK